MRRNGWKLGRVALMAGVALMGLSQSLRAPISMAFPHRGANWTVDSKHWALLEREEARTHSPSGLVDEPDTHHQL